ncbi:hypothetical protein CCAX7_13860 [Capsulimonas corticalis]|uniref:Uncharacterized protein n=1 Tax=Capsulimonas corticalis TaxID=2219043 RepID=A0A402D6Q0_9BACT|nr:hypothetical protein [Capsulimonas corticalis]BDI29335.1 hypothetical protein CCAX7_13860 [Capsulimonas corticalis]
MQTQILRRAKTGVYIFVAVSALAGCGNHQQASPNAAISAQEQQAAQQKDAERKAYYQSHYPDAVRGQGQTQPNNSQNTTQSGGG